VNAKKMFSALGVGLAFVAVLSLLVTPVYAGSGSQYRGTSAIGGCVYAHVSAVWSDLTFEISDADAWKEVAAPLLGSCQVFSEYYVDGSPDIVYAMVEARLNPLFGDSVTIHAWVWMSPGAPDVEGGDWEYL